MQKFLYLAIGGVAGTFARYLLTGALSLRAGTFFPWGTVAVNLCGCFLIGFLDVFLQKKFFLGPNGRVLLLSGFCAAFTTFSTLLLESSNLLKSHSYFYAFGNIALSLGAGFVLLRIGAGLAELL
jgi:CrcB protein